MSREELPECPFLVFSGLTFYPGAGWEDFRGACSSRAAARDLLQVCREYGLDWFQIVDLHTLEVIEQGAFAPHGDRMFTPSKRDDWLTFVTSPSISS